jgi:signal transduction histidine kinase
MRRLKNINPSIAIALVLVITTSITLFGLKTLKDRDAADNWVTSSRSLIVTIDHMLIGIVNMETGLRGYMLSGKNSFLDPYLQGKAQYEASLANLAERTAGNAILDPYWVEIKTLVETWETSWANEAIRLRRDVNAGIVPQSKIEELANSELGKRQIDAIRGKIGDVQQIENEMLNQRLQTEQAANNRAYLVMLTGMAFSVILGIATGLFLRQSIAQNREHIEIQKLLLEEREKERMEIARDLHDGPIQDLLATSYNVQAISAADLPETTAGDLDEVRESIEKVIAEMRAYSMELRSPVLIQFGLEKAIRSHLEHFQQRNPQLKIRFVARQQGELLPSDCRNALFRIFQEAMNNILRHSQATEVYIHFEKQERQAILELRDNGVGFDPPGDWLILARNGHLGLVGIRERADAIGGEVEIRSQPGQGTRLRVVVPY